MNKLTVTPFFIIIILGFSSLLSHAATVDVLMIDRQFQPQNVTINIGDTVRWTNIGGLFHTTTSF